MPEIRPSVARLSIPTVAYLLNDEFTTALGAGSVNGTNAEPGPGVRTVVDTNGGISIANGVLSFATGAVANDALWYGSIDRAAGRVLMGRIIPSEATNGIPVFGWDSAASGAVLDHLKFGASGALQIVANGGTAYTVGAYTAGEYRIAVVMRVTGLFWFIKGGAFTYWTFIAMTSLGSGAGFPAIQAGNTTAVFTADNIRIPAALWLPVPIASDSFVRANGALGVTDGLGHAEANGGSGKTWVFDAGAWVVSGDKAVGTPTETADVIVNGAFAADTDWTHNAPWTIAGNIANINAGDGEYLTQTAPPLAIGVWYRCLLAMTARVAGSVGIYFGTTNVQTCNAVQAWQVVARAGGTAFRIRALNVGDATVDNAIAYPLTLSSLLVNIDTGRADTFRWQQINALTTKTQGGLAVRVNDPVTPTSGIVAYMDGTNVKIDEFTTATAWAALGTAAKVFTADDWLGLHVMGNAWRLYHRVDATGVVTLIASGTTTVLTGNYVSIFNTYLGNKYGKFEDWPVGSLGEFESLNQF